MTTKVLILPGISSSGPSHWQTIWEQSWPGFIRVEQSEWFTPRCQDWIATLEQTVRENGPNTILVAHSLACLLVSHWSATTRQSIKGALLVAVPDPSSPRFPQGTDGFAPFPAKRLPFKSVLIASSDDPFGSLDFNRECATTWGSEFINAGNLGHINSDSKLGEWEQGFNIFKDAFTTN